MILALAAGVACSRPPSPPVPPVDPPGGPDGGAAIAISALAAPGTTAVPAPASPAAPETSPAPAGPSGASGTTGSTGSTGPAGAAVPDPLPRLPVDAVEVRVGATTTPLPAPGSEPVDPAATFEVRLPLGIRNARLVLLDAQDALVPSSSGSEVAAGRSRYTLVPIEPLRAGSRYVLRLEGVESRQVISDDGRAHEPLAVPFLVSGEPPPKAAPPKKGQKKRSR